MHKNKHISSLLLAAALPLASIFSQPNPSVCDHLSMLGPHYQGEYGKWDDKNGQVVITHLNFGIHPARHATRYPSDGNLPRPRPDKPPYVAIPMVPQGSSSAIQLGNTDDGREWERLRTTIPISEDNTLLLVKFAVVMEDPGHIAIRQPKFEFKAYGPDGKVLPCGTYSVVAGGNIPGFQNQGSWIFRNWTTAALDLRNYVGQNITFEATTYDCSEGAHAAMAVFAIECLRSEIKTAQHYCAGVDNSITLAAPPGFTNYQWSTGQTGEVVTVPNPVAGQKIICKFQPYSSLSDACKIEMEYSVPTAETLPPTGTAYFCTGSQALITAPSLYSGSSYLWGTGQTTPTIQVSQPGSYDVTVTYQECPLTATLAVVENPLPLVNITLTEAPTCSGDANGAICTELVAAGQNIDFAWNTGGTTPCISALGAGNYTLTTTNLTSGCTATISQTLLAPPPLNSQLATVRTPACDDDPMGITKANVIGGTPPYEVMWSHGAQGDIAAISEDGSYFATVTDANDCTVVAALDVSKMVVGESHRDIYCFQNNEGWIEASVSGGIRPYQTVLYPINTAGRLSFDSLYSGYYEVHFRDSTGCLKVLPIELIEKRTEPFRIVLQPDTANLGDEIRQTPAYNFPVQKRKWEAPGIFGYCDDCRELIGKAGFSTTIWHYATDTYGCQDSAKTFLTVTQTRFLYAPNILCPDAENPENRYFRVYPRERQLADVGIARLSIYARDGGMVFHAEDCFSDSPSARWDGTVRGTTAQDGVYVWVVEIRFLHGEVKQYSGDVTIFQCKK